LGGVAPEIKLAQERRSRKMSIAVFSRNVVNLGLPPEKVDEFEFNYVPSVW